MKAMGLLGSKMIQGKKSTPKKVDPKLSLSDDLIDSALSGEPEQVPVVQQNVVLDHPAAPTNEVRQEQEPTEAATTTALTVAPETAWTSGESNQAEDPIELDMETPKLAKANPKNRKVVASVVVASAIVIAGVGYFGYQQATLQSAIAHRPIPPLAPAAQNNADSSASIAAKVAQAAQTTQAAPAANTLNPSYIAKEMQEPAPNTATQTNNITKNHANSTTSSAQNSSTSLPTGIPSSEKAYIQWAENQVAKHKSHGDEPTIPSSALSDTPPSGPGLDTGSYNNGSHGGGSYSGVSFAPPPPPYHRPPIPLQISPGNGQTPTRPAWAYQGLPTASQEQIALPKIRATVSIPHTPAPFRVLRITRKFGQEYAFVTPGPIDDGRWVQFGHQFQNGWIVGKINASDDTVAFTAPQGYVVTARVE